jgi:hypothetical protein
MKWVSGGPELPEELLQLLEDGRLVLFCGAGVSLHPRCGSQRADRKSIETVQQNCHRSQFVDSRWLPISVTTTLKNADVWTARFQAC